MKKSCILLVFSIIVGILMCGFVQIEDDELTAQEIAHLINDEYSFVDCSIEQVEDVDEDAWAAFVERVVQEKDALSVINNKIESNLDGQRVRFVETSETALNIELDAALNLEPLNFNIDLPIVGGDVVVAEGVAVTKSVEVAYSIATEIFGGGIRNSIIIESGSAPAAYSFSYHFPDGYAMEQKEDSSVMEQASIMVKNAEGEVVLSIEPPWAEDATGTKVDTYYVM